MLSKLPHIHSYHSSSYNLLQPQQSVTPITPEPDLSISDSYVQQENGSHSVQIDNTLQIDNNTLHDHGYKQIRKICDTLQGEMILAEKIENGMQCAVKKINKTLHQNTICVDNGMSLIVQEDIIKEGFFYKFLTIDNAAITDGIPQFVDFFVDETEYYLLTEYVGNTKLSDFVKQAHIYIKQNRLKLKEWRKIQKYIMWQIVAVIYWCHHDLSICHLDLTMENIMVKDGCFILNKTDNTISINPNLCAKIIDFGLAERFKDNGCSNCNKHGYTNTKHDQFKSPQVFGDGIYSAKKSDIWSIGMILYMMTFGSPPYKTQSMRDPNYRALSKNNIQKCVKIHRMPIESKKLSLLQSMLNVDEKDRSDILQVIKHDYFTSYYRIYGKRIQQQSKDQLIRNTQISEMESFFPYFE